jgi:tetratricopeptide (TPR) repeat protein
MVLGCRQFAFLLALVVALHTPPLHTQTTSTNPELAAHLERGHAAFQAHNQALATQEFRAALKLDPDNAEAHANLGVLAFFQGDCPAAEPEFQSALRASPSLIKAGALLAICERKLGQPDAQADMESAYAQLQDPSLRTQVGVQLADLYFQRGDLDHTLPIVHSLVEAQPDNVDLLFFAQRIYSEMADNTLNKLALLAPDSARMQQLIAERLINAGDLKGAIEHYRKAIALDPRLPGMHFELAESILEDSNDATAQAAAQHELEAAQNNDGDSAAIESLLGRIAVLQNKSDQAYEHYHRANQLNPNQVEAQLGLAALLVDQGKPQEALEFLKSAAQADPMNANAHYRLARVYHSLHVTEEEQKEIKIYEELRATKDRIASLYRQMNRKADSQNDAAPAEKQ